MRAIPDWVVPAPYTDTALGVLKSGKEAEIFVVERIALDDTRRCLLAHKRYRPRSVTTKGQLEAAGFTRTSTFVNDHVYREGRRFRRSRERRAVAHMTDYGKKLLNDRWMGFELDVMTRRLGGRRTGAVSRRVRRRRDVARVHRRRRAGGPDARAGAPRPAPSKPRPRPSSSRGCGY